MVEIDTSSQPKRCDEALKERQVRVPITNEFTDQPERIAWLAGRVSAFCVYLRPPRQRNSTYEAVLELVRDHPVPGCKLNARPISVWPSLALERESLL
jgi:hypothetical protein